MYHTRAEVMHWISCLWVQQRVDRNRTVRGLGRVGPSIRYVGRVPKPVPVQPRSWNSPRPLRSCATVCELETPVGVNSGAARGSARAKRNVFAGAVDAASIEAFDRIGRV